MHASGQTTYDNFDFWRGEQDKGRELKRAMVKIMCKHHNDCYTMNRAISLKSTITGACTVHDLQ